MQISFEGMNAEIVATDAGVFVVSREWIKKVEGKKLVDSDKKKLADALKNTKERLKFSLPSGVMDVLKKELGEFSIGF